MYPKSWRYYRNSLIFWTLFFLLLASAGYALRHPGLLDRGFVPLVLPECDQASFHFCSSFQTLRMDGKDSTGVSGSDVQIARWADSVWTLYPSPKSRDHHSHPRTWKRKQRHAGVRGISRQRWFWSLHDRPACARQQRRRHIHIRLT